MSRFPFIILLFLSLSISCAEEGHDLKGNLVGYIRSLDEFAAFNNDDAGFEVTVMGTSFYSTLTDESGRFEFRDLPAGTWDLSIFKEGYGLMKDFSIQHLGGAPTILHSDRTSTLRYFLYRIPSATIDHISIGGGQFRVQFKDITSITEKVFVQVYFSAIEGFSSDQVQRTAHILVNRNQDEFFGIFNPSFPNFVSGQKIYLRGCIRSYLYGGMSYYYDKELGKTIYPNLGRESEEFSFIFGQ